MKKVKCPTCQQEIEWDKKNAFRPFCCERCRLIDLGEWANESHRIPSSELIGSEPISEDIIQYDIEELN